MIIDHIGYLVKDINKSIEVFKSLGFTQETDIITDDILDEENNARNVLLCFMDNETTRVELVSPINESSDVYATLKRQGEGPYHICYRVPDIEESITRLKTSGWLVLKRPSKAVAFDFSCVAFLFKRGAGMIELVETKE